jgi:AAA15 family ATPase/GTPase
MENQLTYVNIRNFKSLKHVDMQTSRVNLFIGKPNSGKSNLLEAMALNHFLFQHNAKIQEYKFIRASSSSSLFYDSDSNQPISVDSNKFKYLITRGTYGNHELHIIGSSKFYTSNFANPAQLEKEFNSSFKKGDFEHVLKVIKKVQNIFSHINLNDSSVLNITGELNPIECPVKYDFDKDQKEYSVENGTVLYVNGRNLYNVVLQNSKLKEWVANIFPEYGLEFIIDTVSKKFEIQKKQGIMSYKIPFESTPDTVRRMLYHMAAIYSNKDAVILFEEPEAHSFPPYIDELASTIAEDENNQYFITTHSPYMLTRLYTNMTKPNELSIFYTYWEDYQTKVKKLSSEELENLMSAGDALFFNLDTIAV